MFDSNLKKSCNDLIEKILKENSLIKTKISGLDSKEVAKNPEIYERIKPIVDNFQDDLVDVTSKIYNIISDLNNTLSSFFDAVEKDLELIDVSEVEEELDLDSDEVDESQDLDDLEGPSIIVDIE